MRPEPRPFDRPFSEHWLHMLFMGACVIVGLWHPVVAIFAGSVLVINGVFGFLTEFAKRVRARSSA